MNSILKYSLLFWLVGSFFLHAGEIDNLPGGRTVYVENHSKEALVLKLRLRQCLCGKKIEAGMSICNCWVSFAQEDQPAVQGNIQFALEFLQPLQQFVPVVEYDGSVFCRIPGPKLLKTILEFAELDQYFVFLPRDTLISPEDYLHNLSQGKIPIAGIGVGETNESIAMIYHNFFHDFFVHLRLWIDLPEKTRKLLKTRVASIVNLSGLLEQELPADSTALKLWRAATLRIVGSFDGVMGTLGDRIYNYLAKKPEFLSTWSTQQEKSEVEKIVFEKKDAQVLFNQFINFSVEINQTPLVYWQAVSFINTDRWLSEIFRYMIEKNVNDLLTHSDLKNFKDFPELPELLNLSKEELVHAADELIISINKLLTPKNDVGFHSSKYFSFYKFLKQVHDNGLKHEEKLASKASLVQFWIELQAILDAH